MIYNLKNKAILKYFLIQRKSEPLTELRTIKNNLASGDFLI